MGGQLPQLVLSVCVCGGGLVIAVGVGTTQGGKSHGSIAITSHKVDCGPPRHGKRGLKAGGEGRGLTYPGSLSQVLRSRDTDPSKIGGL